MINYLAFNPGGGVPARYVGFLVAKAGNNEAAVVLRSLLETVCSWDSLQRAALGAVVVVVQGMVPKSHYLQHSRCLESHPRFFLRCKRCNPLSLN